MEKSYVRKSIALFFIPIPKNYQLKNLKTYQLKNFLPYLLLSFHF